MTEPPEHDTLTELLLELVDVEVLAKAIQSVPDVSDTDVLRDALIDCLPQAVNSAAVSVLSNPGVRSRWRGPAAHFLPPNDCETCGNSPTECTCGICGICGHTFAACDCAETGRR